MIGNAEIEAQMQRIAASPAFSGAARSRQFLEFCVRRTMSGQAAELKETTIAIEVFLRTTDYDPKVDPIVRVHARRVREKLELYYRTSGTGDPIKIDLPKGGYVPLILRTLHPAGTGLSDREAQRPALAAGAAEEVRADARTNAPLPPLQAVANRELRSNERRLADRGLTGRGFQLVAMGAIVVLIAVLGIAWAWESRQAEPRAELSILKPWDSVTGRVLDPAWSPDGTRLAFAAVTPGDPQSHIYLQDGLQDGQSASLPIRMTQDKDVETRPVWSPDGHELAFIRQIDLNHFDIARYDLAAGAERVAGHFLTYWSLPADHPALDWSADGRFLLTAEENSPSNPVRIVLLSLANGQRRFLTSPPEGSSGDVDARFSPDSQWVAFRRGGLGDLYVVSTKGEQVQPAVRLTFDTKGVRGIAWIDHGRSILYGTQRGNTAPFGLWKIAKDGGRPEPVSPPDFDATDPAVSSRGALVLVHRQIADALVVHSLRPDGSEKELFPSGSIDSSPTCSPDGRQVAFVSTRSGWTELWLYRMGERLPVQITRYHGSGLVFLPSWAPDGQSITFSFRENGATNIIVYDVARRTFRKITSTQKRDITPVYSSDSRFIYFSSNEDGTSRIWRIRADGADRAEPLFLEAVMGFAPSPDGKWLYFLREGAEVVLAKESLIDGTTEDIAHLPGNRTFANDLAVANGEVYVAVSPGETSTAVVYRIDPKAGTAQIATRLHDLPAASVSGLTGFSVAPDGSDLIVGRVKRNESSLYTAMLPR